MEQSAEMSARLEEKLEIANVKWVLVRHAHSILNYSRPVCSLQLTPIYDSRVEGHISADCSVDCDGLYSLYDDTKPKIKLNIAGTIIQYYRPAFEADYLFGHALLLY
jgi:hypothetical protein